MRLLVVEDEPKLSRLVTRGLQAEGYAVDAAADGGAASDFLRANRYDLIVLDLMLPGALSGTDLLRQVRERDREVPILMLTARTAVADKVLHFEAGADDYLTKPFAFAELVLRVKALLRRGPVNRSNALRIGDLEIDRLTHQVRRGGKAIRLTAKEYGLLEYLATHAGRVLSRTMIIEHVWDQSFEGLTNIVDVYIRQLRAKIDDGCEPKLIHTVRSAGYSLNPPEEAPAK